MPIKTNSIARYAAAISLLFFNVAQVNAFTLIDSGVDVVTKHYVINNTLSTISYTSGGISFGLDGPTYPATNTYALSGSFDVDFQHHWMTYSDGDNGQTFFYSTNWIRFTNPEVLSGDLPDGFEFPKFPSEMTTPTDFSGSNSACAFPMASAPGSYCSGFNNGGISGLSGQIRDGKIIFSGNQPNEQYFFGGGYHYHIEAAVVPIPTAFWLFASAMMAFRMKSKSKAA